MILTHKIQLALDQRGDRPCIDAVCGDTARAVEVSLMENGEAWLIPEGTAAVVSYRRVRGGAGGIYDTLPNGGPACTMEENRLMVFLAPQVLAAAGPVELQVMLMQGEQTLNSFAILIHVQGNLSDAAADQESYVNLTDHIRQILQAMGLTDRGQGIHYIVGDDTSTTGVWKGTCPEISQYYDGLMVAYRTITTGGGTTTTLEINGLGPVNIKRNGLNYDVNYYYTKGAVLVLTYVVVDGVGYWQMADVWWMDSDRKTSAVNSTGEMLYLLGSKSIIASGTTSYANSNCYIGDDNCLYSGGVKVLTENSIPDEVPAYVRTEADRVAKLVQSRQNGNTLSMIFGSDLHARISAAGQDQTLEGIRHGAQAMKIIRDRVHIDGAAMLGDYITDDGESPEQALELHRVIHEYFSPAFCGLPQFWCKGNHDGLGESGGNAPQLNNAQIFSAIGAHNAGAVFHPDEREKGYCYRDFSDYLVRIVCLNVHESYNTLMNTTQYNWMRNALNVQEGWKVILLSHIPMDWVSADATMYRLVLDYQDKILCNIHGHLHNFLTGTLQGTSIPRVAIPNMCYGRNNEYGSNGMGEGSDGTKEFGQAETYGKTAQTAADTSFCVLTIDLAQKKLYADHYGAGYDRVVDLSTGQSSGGQEGGDTGEGDTYTNQIRNATTTFGGTEIFGTDGYKMNCRINSVFEEQNVTTGMCCTGFIAVKEGDTVRIKGVTLNGSSTPYVVRYTTTGGNQATDNVSVLGTADANGVYTYTIPASTAAIRLSLGVIDNNSIVTVNQAIS